MSGRQESNCIIRNSTVIDGTGVHALAPISQSQAIVSPLLEDRSYAQKARARWMPVA